MAHFATLDSPCCQLRNPHVVGVPCQLKSQLDADHYGLEKVKCRLMEYLAIVRLRTLTVQEAGTEQAKAQEVTLKKAIDDPAAGASEADNQKENACRALIKASEILVPPQPQSPVARVSKIPFYSEPVNCLSSHLIMSSSMCLASSGHQVRERLL